MSYRGPLVHPDVDNGGADGAGLPRSQLHALVIPSPLSHRGANLILHSPPLTDSIAVGSGSHERRKNVIEGAFGDPANLSAVYSKAKARFDELAAALDQQVRETVSNHLCAIKLDMDSVRDATITLESEREPEFRTRMAQMLDAVEKELRIVHRRAQIVQRRTRIVQRRART
jgi:hypothetical protein